MQANLVILILPVLLLFGDAAKLPSYMKKCKSTDLKCALESAQAALPYFRNGDKDYNVPPLNPLVIEKAEINQSGLKIKFENMKFYFTDNLQFTEIRVDLAKMQFGYIFNTPRVQVLADYEANGKILVLPVAGKGQSNITLENVTLDCTFDVQIVRKSDGHDYFLVSSSKKCVPKQLSRIYYDFTNLFNGDKFLSKTTLTFLNENWKDVSAEFVPIFLDILTEQQDIIINDFEGQIPVEDIFD